MYTKIFRGLVAVVVIATMMCVSSCTQDDVVPTPVEEIVSTSVEKIVIESSDTLITRAGQVSTPNPSNFDQHYSVSLTNYVHQQQGSLGKCGVASYVCARKIRNPLYPTESLNIDQIYNLLSTISVYTLWGYNDGTSKDYFSEPAGNNMWGNKRTQLKSWIEGKISSGKPVVIPTIYNMQTDPYASNAGHFYIIVELFLKNGGTGSVVGVKDVWVNSSTTQYFDYSDLLSSNWVGTQRNYSGSSYTVQYGSETYCGMSFE
jgi:hypothetical protein